jgi:hypothetical protein
MIESLIDKQDNFEVIRDQIAAILVTEVASQKALATAGGKNPALWDFKVYTERSNPWESYLNDISEQTPIVNVWYDNSSFDPSASNVVERQATSAIFNIDCYGVANSSDNQAGGHNPGDQEAAFTVQRTIRLVRNILMAAEYTYLGLRGVVWQRWPQTVTMFQPQQDRGNVRPVIAARIGFKVKFNEFSPQISGNMLELVSAIVKRVEDGQIVIEADYDYTT